MSDMTRVALDAMGGDNAPVEMVKGAVEAVQKRNDIQVLLTGKEEILKEELAKALNINKGYPLLRIKSTIHDVENTITNLCQQLCIGDKFTFIV